MDDAELVSQAQAGDRAALEKLLDSHYSSWYQICRRMTGNDADAADATQEALIAIVKGLPRFDGRSRFSTWSHRVVTNRCLDEMRRRQRRPTPSELVGDDLGESEGSISRHTPDPATAVVSTMELDEKLNLLSDEYRTILVLRDVIGCDYAELSDILEIPVGTVRSRLARARRRLADSFDADRAAATPLPNGNFSASTSVKEVDQ